VDAGVVDGAVNKIADLIQSCSVALRYLQTGVLQQYILAMALGILLMVGVYLIIR